jgi:hypothetical protein
VVEGRVLLERVEDLPLPSAERDHVAATLRGILTAR